MRTKGTLKLVIFFLILAVLWLGLERIAVTLEDRSGHKVLDFSFRNLEQNKKNVNILIFGSSHALYGINPQYFTRFAYNFAYSADDIFHSYLKLKKYIDQMPDLKAVIVCIDYFSFGYRENVSQFRNIAYGYNKYVWDPFSPRYYFERVSPFFRVRPWFLDSFKLRFIKHKEIKNEDTTVLLDYRDVRPDTADCSMMSSGYYYTNRNRQELINPKEALSQITVFADTNYSADNIFRNEKTMTHLIRMCQKKNIRVILVTPPYYHTYYDNFPKSIIEAMHTAVNKLNRHNKGVFYLDYSRDNNFSLEDFLDNDHLNAKGAKIFTGMLDQRLEDILKDGKIKR